MSQFLAQHFFLNAHAIPPFISGLLLLALGFIVLIRDRFSLASLVFMFLMVLGCAWLLGYAAIYSSLSPETALEFCKIENTAVVFIPSFLYLFALIVLKRLSKARWQAAAAFGFSVVLTFFAWTSSLFLKGVYHYSWGYFPKYGLLGFAFMLLFFVLMAASLRLYWQEYKKTRFTLRKWQLKRLFIAFGITIFGAVDYFPAFGIAVYPLGYVTVLIFIVVLAHTVWRYRLQDITPAFAAGQILSAMSDGLMVVDTEGLVRIANPAASRLLKKSEREMLWIPVWSVADGILTRVRLQELLEKQHSQSYESVLYRSLDQVPIYVLASILMDKDQEIAAAVLIIKDMSDQKEAEVSSQRKNMFLLILQQIAAAANKSKSVEEVLQFTIDAMASCMKWPLGHAYVHAAHDKNIFISSKLWHCADPQRYKEFRKITEMTQFEKNIGIPAHIGDLKSPLWIEDIAGYSKIVRRKIALDSGLRSTFIFPVLIENDIEAVLEFFSDQPMGVDSILMEVTTNIAAQVARVIERHRAEMKLKIAYDELEDRVAQRTRALSEANEKLKSLDEMKSNFMLTASHELRTPLTTMKGYLLLILQGKVGPISEQQREFISHVKNATERLERLVNELLNLTRADAQGLELKIEDIELKKLLEDEVRIFMAEAAQKEIELTVTAKNELGVIRADADKIRQVVENLISNALKYTESHGKIKVSASREKHDWILQVSDTGIGIRREDQQKIFDPFYHLHKKGLRGEESTGLGLAVTKKIIEAHGGQITVTSEEGKGANFETILPLDPGVASEKSG